MRILVRVALTIVVVFAVVQRLAAEESTPEIKTSGAVDASSSDTKSNPPLYGGRDFDTWSHLLEVDLDDSTRWHAVEAIGVLGRHGRQEEAYTMLAPLMRSKDPALPQASHHALAALSDKGVRLLVETLQDVKYPHRESIIIALGKAGPRATGSVNALISITQRSDGILRRRAFESLIAIGQPAASIAQVIEREVERNDDPQSTSTIIFRLADSPLNYETKESLLIEWVSNEDRQIAHQAANALAKIGRDNDRVRGALRNAISTYAVDPAKGGAFPSIGGDGINTKLILPLLIEVVDELDLTDPKVRNGAFARLFVDKVGELGNEGRTAVPTLIKILGARNGPGMAQVDSDIVQSCWKLGDAASDALPALELLRTEVAEGDAYRENERPFWLKQIDNTINRIEDAKEAADGTK